MYTPYWACRPPFLPFIKFGVEGESRGSSSGCSGEGGLAVGEGRLEVPRDSTSRLYSNLFLNSNT